MKDRKQDDTNPFSFKKFLQSGAASGSARGRTGGASGPSSLATLDLANDLPDFVQNRGPSDSPSHALMESSLPDFALDSHRLRLRPGDTDSESSMDNGLGRLQNLVNPNGTEEDGHLRPETHNARHLDDHSANDDEEEEEDSFNAAPVICTANSTGGLPDFLSDSGLGHASTSRISAERDNTTLCNGFLSDLDARAELQQVRYITQSDNQYTVATTR